MDAPTADLLRNVMLAEMEIEDALMLTLVEAIPEDRLTWKPDAEKTFRTNELAHHAVAAAQFFLRTMDGTEDRTEALTAVPTDKASLIASVKEIQAHFRTRLAEYTPEKLAAEVDFFGDRQTGVSLLGWQKMHMVHHRAQLALYLRLMGARVPSTYGPSGDEG